MRSFSGANHVLASARHSRSMSIERAPPKAQTGSCPKGSIPRGRPRDCRQGPSRSPLRSRDRHRRRHSPRPGARLSARFHGRAVRASNARRASGPDRRSDRMGANPAEAAKRFLEHLPVHLWTKRPSGKRGISHPQHDRPRNARMEFVPAPGESRSLLKRRSARRPSSRCCAWGFWNWRRTNPRGWSSRNAARRPGCISCNVADVFPKT